MVRTFLCLVAVAALFVAQPYAQGSPSAAQGVAAAPLIVNLNTATVADLEKLPGIGAKTAERIVQYREKNGPFKKIEEVMNVQGIGEKSFLRLKPQLTVAANRPPSDQPRH